MSRQVELEKMFDDNPDDPFIIYALAREYEQNLATFQALLMYEHLVTQHPAYIATYYHYAKLLYSAGNRNEAVRMLQNGMDWSTKENDIHSLSEMKALLSLWSHGNNEEE